MSRTIPTTTINKLKGNHKLNNSFVASDFLKWYKKVTKLKIKDRIRPRLWIKVISFVNRWIAKQLPYHGISVPRLGYFIALRGEFEKFKDIPISYGETIAYNKDNDEEYLPIRKNNIMISLRWNRRSIDNCWIRFSRSIYKTIHNEYMTNPNYNCLLIDKNDTRDTSYKYKDNNG